MKKTIVMSALEAAVYIDSRSLASVGQTSIYVECPCSKGSDAPAAALAGGTDRTVTATGYLHMFAAVRFSSPQSFLQESMCDTPLLKLGSQSRLPGVGSCPRPVNGPGISTAGV